MLFYTITMWCWFVLGGVFHPGFETIFLPYLGYFSNKILLPIDKLRFYLYLCEELINNKKKQIKMKNLQLSLENLEITSKNWNRKTKEILLFVGGSSNQFGGSSNLLHITLHGENSAHETGAITFNGVARSWYNIARGANGDSARTIVYYRGVFDFDSIDLNTPTFSVKVEGSCNGADEALCAILMAEIDWKI